MVRRGVVVRARILSANIELLLVARSYEEPQRLLRSHRGNEELIYI